MWVECIADKPHLILPVVEEMREWDRREIFATRPNDDLPSLANDAYLSGKELGWVAGLERPIAAFGCHEMWNGVYSMWLFATDDFGHIGISMTKLIVRHIVPMLREAGAHRLEARSMEGHHDAQRWLELIGASREATLKGFGRGGEDFHVYTWDQS